MSAMQFVFFGGEGGVWWQEHRSRPSGTQTSNDQLEGMQGPVVRTRAYRGKKGLTYNLSNWNEGAKTLVMANQNPYQFTDQPVQFPNQLHQRKPISN